MKTKTKPYKTAMAIQDACNLVAVIGECHRAALALNSPNLRKNPAMVLFISKIVSLMESDDFGAAWDQCKALEEVTIESQL